MWKGRIHIGAIHLLVSVEVQYFLEVASVPATNSESGDPQGDSRGFVAIFLHPIESR